ncbi:MULTISPECIES: hypothetical protein [unclassified Crossiella]|uniref:hypothetical protein n=1 Tax=unclassified Crossiella TaxID=2620835 RepID=UPI001FFF44F8|nr:MULTISPECIES: hypothetical protein [unclassified Crossiella]MCK2240063.1 hypothetical protein [Crossiella sp. S99.2]MCK2252771.1 hypothetical protein [Crossiella sp. S99.1]
MITYRRRHVPLSDTTHPHTTDVVTLWVNGRDSRDGTATLTPIVDTTSGHTVHIVTIDERAAECYGLRQPVSVIGGLVRIRNRWSPTAYRDRAHLLGGGGLVYFLPNVPSRVRAVRALLRWWWEVTWRAREGADPRHLDPCQELPAFRLRLLA